jgi:enoyl-[acyl-carrier protein] reductase III
MNNVVKSNIASSTGARPASLKQVRQSSAPPDDFEEAVVGVIARLTRYPRDLLTASADLEEDLGIESVKRGEIYAALATRYQLPSPSASPARPVPKTVGDLIELVRSVAAPSPRRKPDAAVDAELFAAPEPTPAAAAPGEMVPAPVAAVDRAVGAPAIKPGAPTSLTRTMSLTNSAISLPRVGEKERQDGTLPPPASGPSSADPPQTNGRGLTHEEAVLHVVRVVAELTRYPMGILTEDANLEDDLGIDSVKRGEILFGLRERLNVSEADVKAAFAAHPPRTIGEIAAALEAASPRHAPPAAVANGHAHETMAEWAEPAVAREALRVAAVDAGTMAALPARASVDARPFANKVAFVTGSGHGLGRTMALRLSQLGATVVINSFYSRERGEETAREIVESGGTAEHIWGSMANPQQLSTMFDAIEDRYGGVDFFVHNASNGVIGPLDQVTESHWDRGFRTNVVGLHQGAYRAAKSMKKRGGGRIIALSSPGAQRTVEYFGCMGPIKAAVESLALYLAVELGEFNVTVNVVSAYAVYGERITNYPDADRLIPYWERLSPDGRLVSAKEVSDTVMFLLSNEAARINGAVLLVDGAASRRM